MPCSILSVIYFHKSEVQLNEYLKLAYRSLEAIKEQQGIGGVE